MPAPGAPTPELRVARIRTHARRLTWSALVLIAVAGAVGYFTGNLPAPFEDWMLWAAAGAVVLLLVIVPFLAWWSHVFTITTRRVIERSGLFSTRRRELSHVRGYTIQVRRGILQRMWGAGTLVLSNGAEPPLRMADIPSVALVHETLVDQVEVNQILAHRDAQPLPPGPPPPLPA
jgi:membrane protein YdbS with pleckstrin-like domain